MAVKPACECSRERKSGEAFGSIHSSCGKPCGKPGYQERTSLISNEKDQAAHKWVHCCNLLNINTLLNYAQIAVPVGEHSAGNPAITRFSTIGFRECPTGRGFWRSGPCETNSCKAFARKGVNGGCPPCYGSCPGRVPSSRLGRDFGVRERGTAAGLDQVA